MQRTYMSSNKRKANNKKSVEELVRLVSKELKDLRIRDSLRELQPLWERAEPKRWDELTEDEQNAIAKEQAEAEREFIREQRFLRVKRFLQLIIKAKSDNPNSKLFTTAEEMLEFVVQYESNPSSVSSYEWNRFQTILLTRCESLLNVELKAEQEQPEKPAEKADKQDKATTTSQPDSIIGDTWTIFGIPINVKKLRTKLKSHPILLICFLSLIVIIATYSLWHPLINKTNHGSTVSVNIFADVSKDGTILRSNNFPWKIQKSVDQDGNILYTMVDRRGDATAISVVPDNPEYTVYQSYGGMVIKYTCAEEKISNFTIKVKY